jgi:hypothetical protein
MSFYIYISKLCDEMPHQDAVVQLAEALHEHFHAYHMPESDELVNADKFLDLEGEQEVCEVESVEEIVAMVTTDHRNAVDSDEDEWKPPTLNAQQAFESARLLKDFMLTYPRYFSGNVLHCVDEIASGCSSMAAESKKQASLKE